MQRIPQDIFDRITLDASLQRLGVVELEERMEFSPLLVEGGLQPTRADEPLCCVCNIPDDQPDGWPDLHVGDPGRDGMGTTGPTSGGGIG